MVAIVGTPGSVHHDWMRFRRCDRAAAAEWLRRRHREILTQHPAVGTLPTELISDREAGRRRWRDGRRIYVCRAD